MNLKTIPTLPTLVQILTILMNLDFRRRSPNYTLAPAGQA